MANQLSDHLRITHLGIILTDDDASNILLLQEGGGVGYRLNLKDRTNALFLKDLGDRFGK